MLQDSSGLLLELLFVAKIVSQQWGLELFLLMTVVVVKLALVSMDYQGIWVGPVLLPLHEESLVDHTEHLLRVPLVDLNALLRSVVLVTVNVIVLSCHLLGLPPSLVHQVTSQTSVIINFRKFEFTLFCVTLFS